MHGIRVEAVVDLGAVAANVRTLLAVVRRTNPAAGLMAVVKADGYGHGAVEVGRTALANGATALGLATPTEAMALVDAGISSTVAAPLVAWLWLPDEDIRRAISSGIQLVVSSVRHLVAVAAVASEGPGGSARIHLKIDTGLGRNGATPADFADLAAAALRTRSVEVVGLMSHLANADLPDDGSVREQIEQFSSTADRLQRSAGHRLQLHLANTPGTLQYPDAVFDLVRCGIGVYGVNPFEPGQAPPVDLRQAMTLRAWIALTKRVPAGHGVSYGLTYRTAAASTLALVPAGYADGVPRSAGSSAEVLLAGGRRRIAGRVAMDQFVIDCGDDEVAIGDEVVLFGPGERGEPTAAEWAAACGTIGYEIVTRIGVRVPRRYLPEPEPE